MKIFYQNHFYLYDSYLSSNWIDYSKLIIKSDNYNWVFDNIRKELKNVFDNLQVDVINDRFFIILINNVYYFYQNMMY